MSRYRRADTPGGTYFFAVVTYRRREILTEPESRTILREVINTVKQRHPFTLDAWVLLPDHLNSIWTLPKGDKDFAKRWGMIKAGFSKRAKHLFHREEWMNETKTKRRESTLWQRRYWEHQIRDEDDFRKHMDYLHYNPVQHGLVKRVIDWPYSTFHRYLKRGVVRKIGVGRLNWMAEGLVSVDGARCAPYLPIEIQKNKYIIDKVNHY